MPEKNGYTLTDGEKQAVLHWLKTKWKSNAGATAQCPMCGTHHWEIYSHVVQTRTWTGGNMLAGGFVDPCIVVTCRNCGNSVFLNADKVGIETASH
jgi:predicted nucleic-acid-binding Zn-ribbon protein